MSNKSYLFLIVLIALATSFSSTASAYTVGDGVCSGIENQYYYFNFNRTFSWMDNHTSTWGSEIVNSTLYPNVNDTAFRIYANGGQDNMHFGWNFFEYGKNVTVPFNITAVKIDLYNASLNIDYSDMHIWDYDWSGNIYWEYVLKSEIGRCKVNFTSSHYILTYYLQYPEWYQYPSGQCWKVWISNGSVIEQYDGNCPHHLNKIDEFSINLPYGLAQFDNFSYDFVMDNLVVYDGENSYNSQDCAVQFNNLSQLGNCSNMKKWISVNMTYIQSRTQQDYATYLCTINPDWCWSFHFVGSDESGNVLWALDFYNQTDIYSGRYIEMPFGEYYNVKCRLDLISMNETSGEIEYMDCGKTDRLPIFIKISDTPPANKKPQFRTFTIEDFPNQYKEFYGLIPYTFYVPIDFGYSCVEAYNLTHYHTKRNRVGSIYDELRPYTYFGYDNYTQMNQTQLLDWSYCQFNSVADGSLVFGGSYQALEPYFDYSISLRGQTIKTIIKGIISKSPLTNTIALVNPIEFLNVGNYLYLESAIVGDGICGSLETYIPNSWNYDDQCFFERYGYSGITGYTVAIQVRNSQFLIILMGAVVITLSILALVSMELSIGGIVTVAVGIVGGIAIILMSLSALITP